MNVHPANLPLHPADVVVSGDFPSTYAWGEDLYKRLGGARFQRVKAMPDWQPRS